MKIQIKSSILAVLFGVASTAGLHAQGTSFTYQGQLQDDGQPASGVYDLEFRVFDMLSGGIQQGNTTNVNDLSISNGLFTVTLNPGANVFTGAARWLSIAVRPGASTGAYTNLLPRHSITAAPYAIYAGKAMMLDGTLPGSQLSGTYSSTLTFNNGANNFTGNGAGLTALNANNLANGTVPDARLSNNVARLNVNQTFTGAVTLSNPGNSFTGNGGGLTNVSVSGLAAGTYPNQLTFSNPANSFSGSNAVFGGTVTAGEDLVGRRLRVGLNHTLTGTSATIAGGLNNTASGNFATVSGGNLNNASGAQATVGGGFLNVASATAATVAGGSSNMASGNYAFAAGRRANALHSGAFVWADSQNADFATTASNQFLIRALGGVGIGTTSPTKTLDVRDGASQTGSIHVGGTGANGDPKLVSFGDGDFVRIGENGVDDRLELAAGSFTLVKSSGSGGNGFVGIGTSTPARQLEVKDSGDVEIGVTSTDAGGRAWTMQSSGDAGGLTGTFQILDRSTGLRGMAIYPDGNVSVCKLTITGGCDLAEPFAMSGEDIPKGAVVVIDEQHPGQLKLSERAYDTRVAGIISGAGGVSPGIQLKQEGVLDAGQNVALTGRVYAQADASHGAIKPGDLLTTSDTPGHAMKATNRDQAQGAILGKAMSALEKGRGMVLVLVSLQ